MDTIYRYLDKRGWLSHGLIALALMVCTVGFGMPVAITAALALTAFFFARAQREQEYDDGVKSWRSFLFWDWRPKLVWCFITPTLVSWLFVFVRVFAR